MPGKIDYFFTSISPFAWLGHKLLMEIAARHGVGVRFRPVNLAGVWAESGALPLPKRPPIRQRYRLVELQRFAELRGLEMNPNPANFPADPTLADCCIIAIAEGGGNPSEFFFEIGQALWRDDALISDENVIMSVLGRTDHDAAAIVAKARSEESVAIREANTRAAIDADAIGSPAYVYKGEVFWGQDRLDLLERMIAAGRPAFSSDV